MPLTEAEKSARKRKSKKENGLVRLPDYGTEKQRDDIRAYLRGEAEIKLKGEDMEDAFSQGYRAYNSGLGISDNPFLSDTGNDYESADKWMNGYLSAKNLFDSKNT